MASVLVKKERTQERTPEKPEKPDQSSAGGGDADDDNVRAVLFPDNDVLVYRDSLLLT